MTHHPFKSGQCRDQVAFLPPRIEDYVARDNPVRAVEAYVASLNLAALRFCHTDHKGGAGQPPYDPADLLKLYLYGYLNQVRSSRRLERELRRNVELMWLLRGLTPGFRTIASFRAENAAALKAVNRDFVMLLRRLDLVDAKLVAVDGAFFDGNASKASITSRKRLAEDLAAVERDIEAYNKELDANDAAEAKAPTVQLGLDLATEVAKDMAKEGDSKLAALLAKRSAAKAGLAQLDASGQTQLSRTDADARLLSKHGQVVAGYNVQIAVDSKHKLIVASEVVNDGNDTGQLHALALAAKQALGAQALTVVADAGYFNGDTLRACEADAIEAFVPEPRRGQQSSEARLGLDAFSYDAAADEYVCPNRERLRPMPGRKLDVVGKTRIRYASRRLACKTCPLRQRCLSPAGDRRVIERWEHEAVLERHRARMKDSGEMLQRRKALAEHPFGTLKCRAGYRHFLMRGFDKTRGEWSLMALCYNFTRVLTIIGIDKLLAALLKGGLNGVIWLVIAALTTMRRFMDRSNTFADTLPSLMGSQRSACYLRHAEA